MKKALIFANGDLNDGLAVQNALAATPPDLIIAADGGADLALQLGYSPVLVVGDMDSVHPATLEKLAQVGVEILRFPPEKNETDLELALIEAVQRGAEQICVIGALGDRLDQTLANAYLLSLPDLMGKDTRYVSGTQTVWLLYPGEHDLIGDIGDTISLIPLSSEVTGISTKNLQYVLHQETLQFGPARGISNVVANSQPRLRFETGLLLVIHTIGRA